MNKGEEDRSTENRKPISSKCPNASIVVPSTVLRKQDNHPMHRQETTTEPRQLPKTSTLTTALYIPYITLLFAAHRLCPYVQVTELGPAECA